MFSVSKARIAVNPDGLFSSFMETYVMTKVYVATAIGFLLISLIQFSSLFPSSSLRLNAVKSRQ